MTQFPPPPPYPGQPPNSDPQSPYGQVPPQPPYAQPPYAQPLPPYAQPQPPYAQPPSPYGQALSGQPQPVPGQFPGAVADQPPKRKHTLRNVLIIVGVVLVVLCGGAIVGGVALVRTVLNSTRPVSAAADAYLFALEQGDTEAAYALLCSADRRDYSQAEFATLVGHDQLTSHKITNVMVNSTNGVTTGSVTATLTYEGGRTASENLSLTKDSEIWHLCGNLP